MAEKKKFKVKVNPEYCKLCEICVNFCPVKNLKINNAKLIEMNKCIGCQTCERYCPDMAIEVEELLPSENRDETTPAGK